MVHHIFKNKTSFCVPTTLTSQNPRNKKSTKKILPGSLPVSAKCLEGHSGFYTGTLHKQEHYCQGLSTAWRTESAASRTYSTPQPPPLHTDFLRKKKKKENNQARGQCLQRSHSHCSEKTSHLHHSPHAISFGLAEFCLQGPAPDVLYHQMPGVPHPGDQQPELFSMSCNYCSRTEKGCMRQGGNPKVNES